MSKKCARPTCENRASKNGHCNKHAYALGLIRERVDARRITAAVRAGLEAGWSVSSLADAAGRSPATIANLRDGKYRTVTQKVESSLLQALEADEPLMVPGWRATRRVTSLRAAGFSILDLAEGMGTSRSQIIKLSRDVPPERVTVEFFGRLDEFWRAHAADPVRPVSKNQPDRGWTLPMAWWDIDDPDERRDPLTPAQRGDIVPKSFALRDAARFLMDSMTDRALEKELGTSRITARNIVEKPDGGIARESAHRVLHLARRLGWEPGQNTEKDVA